MDEHAEPSVGRPEESKTDRQKRLEAILDQLECRFGPWIVYRLKDARPVVGERAISSGALSLDLATGIGGFPRGRIAEVIGPVSSGKSLLAFHLIANAQQRHGFAAFVDAAHRANFEQMARCGVVLSDLFIVVPEDAREALDIAALLAESGGLDALVVGPLSDLIGRSHHAAHGLTEKLAELNAAIHRSPTAIVFLTDTGFQPSLASLQRAMRHFASLRIEITPLRPLVHPSGDIYGLHVRASTIKNKLAPGQRVVELDLRRDRGIHREADLLDLGLASSLIVDKPFGLCFGNLPLGRGRARAIATLERDPTLAQRLQEQIVQLTDLSRPPASSPLPLSSSTGEGAGG